ncbi:MAG: acetylxylan esterase [Planctomycetota bacterium]
MGLPAIAALLAAAGFDASTLPDPLVTERGDAVLTAAQWRDARRPELLELFRTHVYGRRPIERPSDLRLEPIEQDRRAMRGAATLQRVAIRFGGDDGGGALNLTIFTPNGVDEPVPGFLLICHRNAAENLDPTRRRRSGFWPAERIVRRGFFAAAFHCGDLDADDKDDSFADGVHGLYDPPTAGGAARPGDAWGALSAWAWGASRALDCFEALPRIDATRVAVVGHSRGGKAALWAGATDRRFALTISNNSGCGGASLARHAGGETVRDIVRFRNWFCRNYDGYADNESALPIDQHQLIALLAPRLAYVASASEDAWADPEGERLACVHASPVYELLGGPGLESPDPIKRGETLHAGRIGYHLRRGEHDLTPYDWRRFMDFADRWWR